MTQNAFTIGMKLLGFGPNWIEPVARARSMEEARKRLEIIQAAVKRKFKALAFELHPDRTGGDPRKTEQFRLLSEVAELVEKMEVIVRSPPPPQFVRIQFVPLGGAGYYNTSASTGGMYWNGTGGGR